MDKPPAKAALPVVAEPPGCDWHEDDDGLWQMSCGGNPWLLEDGVVVENRVKFCMHCSAKVRIVVAPSAQVGDAL